MHFVKKILTLLLLIATFPALANSPVWRVQSADHTLFLVGTIHLLRASDYPLPAALDEAYRQASQLVFETDIEQTRSPEFSRQMMQAMTLPKGKTLADRVQPDTWKRLQQFAQSRHIPLDRLSGFKPGMVSITLTLLEMQRLGIHAIGVDEYYDDRARADGKTRQGLESVQQQIGFLAEMGHGVEDQMLLQTLDEISQLDRQYSDMIKSWRSGDLQQMNELLVKPMREHFTPLYRQLLVERNQAWLPQIERMLDSAETEMVLVGSAHLVGPDGLLQQLQQAGYRISQLP